MTRPGLKGVVVKIRVPFLGTPNNRCRIIIMSQKGSLILTTTQIGGYMVPNHGYLESNSG